MRNPKRYPFTVRLNATTEQRLFEVAEKKGESSRAVARAAIEAYLKRHHKRYCSSAEQEPA